MTKYAVEPSDQAKIAKSRGSHLRVHFKHCRNICKMISGKEVQKSKKYLQVRLNE